MGVDGSQREPRGPHLQLLLCGLTENDVLSKLRQTGARRISDLRYVLHETRGELTVVPERGEPDERFELVQAGLRDAAGGGGRPAGGR